MKIYHLFEGNYNTFIGLNEASKQEFIADKLGSKLLAAAERDHSYHGGHDPMQIVTNLEKMDPTVQKTYLQWLAKQYAEGHLSMENAAATHEQLTMFHKGKSKLTAKDINQYKTPADLHNALQGIKDELPQMDMNKKERREKAAHEGTKILFEEPGIKIMHVYTRAANCFHGRDSNWCTAAYKGDDTTFNGYNEAGNIYVIKAINPETGEEHKYQLHYQRDQLMEKDNTPITKESIKLLSHYGVWRKFLNSLIAKHYGNPPDK